MNALLVIAAILTLSLQNLTKKDYSVRSRGGATFIFSAISCFAACLFFLVSSGFSLKFDEKIIPYVILFSLSYGTAVAFSFLAIKTGSLSVSSLIASFSLIVPTLYGLLVFGEEVSVFFYIGLGLLAISLVLINLKKDEEKKAVTLLWIISVILCFLGNGMCSTVQAVQQKDFVGEYKNELMIFSLVFVGLVLLVISFVTERGEIRSSLKLGAHDMVICGVANGVTNLLIMILVGRMNTSLMYPLVSGGNIIITAIASIFLYKEKLTRNQLIGLLIGVGAIVFMNI